MSAPPPIAPGWYPDPWYPGVVRWFDGTQWTEHAAPAGGMAGRGDAYDGAKGESMARLAGLALLARGFAASFQAVATPVVFGRMWDDMVASFDDPAPTQTLSFATFTTVSLISQLLGLVGLAALVLICIWSFRATSNARALGLRTTFAPGWTVAGWIIPLANFVMPYVSVRDLFPEGDPGRRQAGIWWACEITGIVLGFVALVVAVATSAGPAAAVGAVSAGFLIAAGVLGFRLTGVAAATHAAIVAGNHPR